MDVVQKEIGRREEQYTLELKSTKDCVWYVLDIFLFVSIYTTTFIFLSLFLNSFTVESSPVVNSALKVFQYIIPFITSIVFAIVNGAIQHYAIRDVRCKQLIIRKEELSMIDNILTLFPAPTKVNRLLSKLIETYMHQLDISEESRNIIREHISKYEEGSNSNHVSIYLLDGDKSTLVDIDYEKLTRYHFFKSMIDDKWSYDTSLVVLDGYSIKDYTIFLKFISEVDIDELYVVNWGGIRILNTSELRKLYTLADIYDIKDGMVYCYLLKPDEFILEISNV